MRVRFKTWTQVQVKHSIMETWRLSRWWNLRANSKSWNDKYPTCNRCMIKTKLFGKENANSLKIRKRITRKTWLSRNASSRSHLNSCRSVEQAHRTNLSRITMCSWKHSKPNSRTKSRKCTNRTSACSTRLRTKAKDLKMKTSSLKKRMLCSSRILKSKSSISKTKHRTSRGTTLHSKMKSTKSDR